MSIYNNLFVKNNIDVKNYIQFNDIPEPHSLNNKEGALYKLNDSNGIWWKSESEPAIDLTYVESNTVSNLGGGVPLFKQKTGVDLEFNSVNSTLPHINISLDSINDEIDIEFDQTQITETGALNAGSIIPGFGDIETISNITTTGIGSFGSINVNPMVLTGTSIVVPDNATNSLTIETINADYININSIEETIQLLQNVELSNHIMFKDITTPSNPGTGEGLVYKKTNDDLFWLSNGVEINLVNVFGTEFQSEELTTTSTTTISNAWTLRQSMVTPDLPVGNYRIEFTILYGADTTKAAARVRVQVNNSSLFGGKEFSSKINNSNSTRNQHYNASDIYTGSGILTIDIDFRRRGGGGTTPTEISLYYSKITIWRIS